MGVAGSGKSTIMRALAARLAWPAAEADEFHLPTSIDKMRRGIPLTDEDRWPWLEALARWIGEHESAGRSSVATCSALRRSYRDVLRRGHPSVWFAHLAVPIPELEARLRTRRDHYMPATLLGSQLETLEPLETDEPGATIGADRPPDEIVDDIVARLAADRDALAD
jgi:gluconokinase